MAKGDTRLIYTSLRIAGHYKRGNDKQLFRGDNRGSLTPVINEQLFFNLVKNDEQLISLHSQLDNNGIIYKEFLHDIKKLSSHIRNKAEEIIQLDDNIVEISQQISVPDTLQRVKNIEAMAGIMTSRFAVFDLTANPTILSQGEKRERVIYQKFHKAKYMLTNYLNKNVTITLLGNSLFKYAVNQSFDTLPFILLENAVKYSPDNAKVQVSFREEHNNLYISIRSIGPFCPPEDLPHIFDWGYRGSLAMNSGAAGSGLGLYIAKKICGEHSITIRAESTKSKKGSHTSTGEFTIYLSFFAS